MHSLQKEFLPLINQLGKILENFRNYFLSPQLVGIENILLFGFLSKNFNPSTKCQKSGKICIVLEKFLLLINWELFRPKGKIVFQPYTNQL